MILDANAYEDLGAYQEALELFVFAADRAEENGEAARASKLRGRARRIVAWQLARKRWPKSNIELVDVRMVHPKNPEREHFQFEIWRRDHAGLHRAVVSVSAAGRMRVLHAD